MRKGFILTTLAAALALTGGCSKDHSKDAIAKVNGRSIPVGQFETKMGRVANLPGKDFSSNEKKRELLNELINEELLFQAALKDGIIENSERLRREVAREYLTTRLGKDRYEPNDKEIQDFYETKKNDLERIRASHILIKPDKPGDPTSEAAALKKANVLLAKIRAEKDKADFAKYAREQSQDESNKARGGDLFFFDRKKMVLEFSDVAFALKAVGDVSDVVKTQYGYHIIKLTGEQRGLDFFRHSIKWQIAQEKQKETSDKLFEKLRNKASVKIYDDVLAKVQVPTGPPPQGMPGGMPSRMPGGMPQSGMMMNPHAGVPGAPPPPKTP
ncbi:MAG TPA: peptidylprolyl isomerase, partial [Bdellovibrionota bacterium]|nr:peptidylprolyl isomerase [Bdellovibrionota bacterium]